MEAKRFIDGIEAKIYHKICVLLGKRRNNMIEIEKNGKIIFTGEKKDIVNFLHKKGLKYNSNNIPLLILGHLASGMGYSIYLR